MNNTLYSKNDICDEYFLNLHMFNLSINHCLIGHSRVDLYQKKQQTAFIKNDDHIVGDTTKLCKRLNFVEGKKKNHKYYIL